jgi:hypothetical protein
MAFPAKPISGCRSISSFYLGLVRLQPHQTARGCRELAHDACPRLSGTRKLNKDISPSQGNRTALELIFWYNQSGSRKLHEWTNPRKGRPAK